MEDAMHLMCGARGCPNRWSVDAGNGRLCSAHAWKPAKEWPSITDSLGQVQTLPSQVVRQVSYQEKVEILRKLQGLGRNPSRVWAEALKEREDRGERLTPFQRSAWREALGAKE